MNGLTGADVRGGVAQANDVFRTAQNGLKELAHDTRWQGLTGKDREEFFSGMTQKEYDLLQDVAFKLGPKGANKLEAVLQEMVGARGSE